MSETVITTPTLLEMLKRTFITFQHRVGFFRTGVVVTIFLCVATISQIFYAVKQGFHDGLIPIGDFSTFVISFGVLLLILYICISNFFDDCLRWFLEMQEIKQ
jgi:hypothetical protein